MFRRGGQRVNSGNVKRSLRERGVRAATRPRQEASASVPIPDTKSSQPEHQRADGGEGVPAERAQINRPASLAAGTEDVEPWRAASRGRHRGALSRPNDPARSSSVARDPARGPLPDAATTGRHS